MKTRIGVIEDNQVNIDLIRYQLEVESFEVFIEQTGKKGLKMIIDQKPDLILLDIGLPDIDGFELCKTLRSDERTKNSRLGCDWNRPGRTNSQGGCGPSHGKYPDGSCRTTGDSQRHTQPDSPNDRQATG